MSTIKCDYNVYCAVKTVFYFTFGYFLRTPDNSNLFSISLEGSSYRESTEVDKQKYRTIFFRFTAS